MKRIWPGSMMGQMLLAVALALFLVQGIGAFLIYRAQSERGAAALINSVAFRIVSESRNPRTIERPEPGHRRSGERRRRFRLEYSEEPPIRLGEHRDLEAEQALTRILADQDMAVAETVVVHRDIRRDPIAMRRAMRRAQRFGHSIPSRGMVMIAGVRLAGSDEWRVARSQAPFSQRALIVPLILQTLLIYLVVVGAVALIMRRITRPLAALTGRVQQFTRTRDSDGQIAPQGPDDIHRLISAHNQMEHRITSLLDEKDVMLGAIGHDLKTPLAALRVRIESVEDETERDKMAATIEDIVASLDDILSLARVGRLTDTTERTELSALLSSVVEEYEDMGQPVTLAETQRIALELRPTWLRRALRNLIGNALRYGDRARVSMAREGGLAVISIADDGPGISEAQIPSMMEPFVRGEPSRNSATGGAGLGLALARAIADQHGGALTLTNRRDAAGNVEGLTATLELPVG